MKRLEPYHDDVGCFYDQFDEASRLESADPIEYAITSRYLQRYIPDNVSGNLVNGYVYDPFGNLFEQNETVANPWQYASGYMDSATGLYHFGARYYNSTLGRWTQEDPTAPALSSPDTLNPYLYVTDNPVNGTDANGRDVIGCVANLIAGAIGFVGSIGALAASAGALGIAEAGAATVFAALGLVSSMLALISVALALALVIFFTCGVTFQEVENLIEEGFSLLGPG